MKAQNVNAVALECQRGIDADIHSKMVRWRTLRLDGSVGELFVQAAKTLGGQKAEQDAACILKGGFQQHAPQQWRPLLKPQWQQLRI